MTQRAFNPMSLARRSPKAEGARSLSRNRRFKLKRQRAAFTLIECALVTVIVGVGVLAIVSAQQAFHQQNSWSQRVGSGLLLANEIREMTLRLPQHDPITDMDNWGPEDNETDVADFDDLDDFDGFDSRTDTPDGRPIDGQRQGVPDLPGWSQRVTVENVLPDFINGPAESNGGTDIVRITCRVHYQGPNETEPNEVTRLTWVRAGDR